MNKELENISGVDLQKEPSIWGFWATFGFSVLISIVFVAVQIVVSVVFLIAKKVQDPSINIQEYTSTLQSNGMLLGLCSLFSGIAAIGLILLLAKLKKGITLKQYLKLNPIRLKGFLSWFAVLVGLIIISDITAYFIKGQIVPEVMHEQYESAGIFLPLMLFSIIVVAPLCEELFFRGFLFDGIKNSKLGSIGAVLITSVFWAVIHMQYDFFGIVLIFGIGILLAIAKLKTNSLYTTILLHSAMNIIATSECIIIHDFLR